ncbi:hypothetical protein [Pseudogulbenkiania sp. MAI-1]|uniref:hypothetical protein n=1 Tax=Pseudogulbenkiania sp. MAI-1 TaxID=990370 RepID=UPI0012EB79FE|nr:hypothetical protein [Pseudogulbenkiania sp. MAI-1]
MEACYRILRIMRPWSRLILWTATFFVITACTKANHLVIDIPERFRGTREGVYCAKKDFNYIVFMSFPYGNKLERGRIEDLLGRVAFEGELDVEIGGAQHVYIKMNDLRRSGFSAQAVYGNSKNIYMKKGCYPVKVRVNKEIPIASRLEIGVYPKTAY